MHTSLPECFHSFNNFCIEQFSEDFFTFEGERGQTTVNISINSNNVTRHFSLGVGKRQTLLLPSDLNDEWLLVS